MNNINTSDICFLIPSYNRYEKLCNLLSQIKDYDGANAIIYNDASTIGDYNNIVNLYPNTKVIHGHKNNGRANFNLTIKSLFEEGINSDFKYFIVIADDMILCHDFINHVKKLLDDETIVNLFSISDSGWKCSAYIDGVFSISKSALKHVYDLLPNYSRDVEKQSTGVWQSVTVSFCGQNSSKYRLACLNYSLVQHNGNEDSKLHFKFRKQVPITAKNYYNNFNNPEIKIISYSKHNNKMGHKKKNLGGIQNGNQIENANEKIPTKINDRPIINKPITSKTKKLHKPNNNTISRIQDDIFVGKIRKKNLNFGRR